MPGLYSKVKTVVDGETITAADRNAEHDNHITNAIPTMHDDYSANATEMQVTTDPYPGAVESLATALAGELARLRYLIKQITGEAQWYIDPDTTLADAKVHDDATAEHGATGAVVGTTNTQTLANKTLTAPTVVDGSSVQAGRVKDQGGGTELKCKMVEIGDWNMVSTGTKDVAHGLTLAGIHSVSVMIRNDDDTTHYNLLAGGGIIAGGYTCGSTNVALNRTSGGAFDGISFDSPTYNRGWITIWYV